MNKTSGCRYLQIGCRRGFEYNIGFMDGPTMTAPSDGSLLHNIECNAMHQWIDVESGREIDAYYCTKMKQTNDRRMMFARMEESEEEEEWKRTR